MVRESLIYEEGKTQKSASRGNFIRKKKGQLKLLNKSHKKPNNNKKWQRPNWEKYTKHWKSYKQENQEHTERTKGRGKVS